MTDIAPPIMFRWTGHKFEPSNSRAAEAAAKYFAVGENYVLVEHQQRSSASHSHYFAALNDAFQNLPDDLAARFPSVEHLRKYALITAGFYDSSSVPCASKAEALRIAAWARPTDEFAVIVTKEAVVTRYTAKSQSRKAMGREEFQRSKDGVLQVISDLVGVTKKALEGNSKP